RGREPAGGDREGEGDHALDAKANVLAVRARALERVAWNVGTTEHAGPPGVPRSGSTSSCLGGPVDHPDLLAMGGPVECAPRRPGRLRDVGQSASWPLPCPRRPPGRTGPTPPRTRTPAAAPGPVPPDRVDGRAPRRRRERPDPAGSGPLEDVPRPHGAERVQPRPA